MIGEIKIRAWDKEDCVMRSVLGFSLYHGAVSVDIGNGRYLQDDSSRFDLMEHTGLEDRKGMEIYENDILDAHKFKQYIVRFGEYVYTPDWVSYSKHLGWYAEEIGDKDEKIPLLYAVDALDGIVEGNIYENTELLEG